MSNIGRPQSGPQLTVIKPTKRMRPNPLKGMSKSARNIWQRTVRAYPADYFSPAQYGLLKAYAESEAALGVAVKEVRKSGQCIIQKNGIQKRNPWCAERDANIQLMASLATKLKLNDKQKAVPKKPKSKREGLIYKG